MDSRRERCNPAEAEAFANEVRHELGANLDQSRPTSGNASASLPCRWGNADSGCTSRARGGELSPARLERCGWAP